jgi:uracil-DNA glycosylase
MPGDPRTDAPRSNKEPAEVARKSALLEAPHVHPLTRFVMDLRARRPAAAVPNFDPTEAGIEARILLLLEAPGRRAALDKGSGFVSPDNNDQTAENMWRLLRDAGIDRGTDVVTWNVVPWYLGDGQKIRGARSGDLADAREATTELLGLLPHLRVAVLLGKPAAKAWVDLGIDMPTVEAGHPSPMNVNTRPGARQDILTALRKAKEMAA